MIGSEILYVAFLADAHTLELYSWGDNFAWAYQSKYHYLLSGLLWIIVAWMPYLTWRARAAMQTREQM